MKKTYSIEVDCANCALRMEDVIRKVDGISDAVINFMAQKLTVDIDDGQNEKAVMKQALRSCRRVERDCEIYF
ncbi:MAG: heavy-metal-associated domain-containing protein [Ruminococcaceae bacterium]|nr:heavy-metal-associated domain-containing protein [Oscillospiraceae bacterium]